MGKMIRPALLALAALCCAQVAQAADCFMTPGNQCVPKVVLVDPTTGSAVGPSAASTAVATITQTRVTLTAATSGALIGANASRKSLRWMNTGANPMTCVPGSGPAVAGVGMNYDPGSSTSNQGGGSSFDGGPVPTNAFSCISTGGTSATVWEGN